MTKYGLRVFPRDGEVYVEGFDGEAPVWKAIEERKVGSIFLRRREIMFLKNAEEYYAATR